MKNDTLRIIGACTVGAFALIGVGYVVTKKLLGSKSHYCHCDKAAEAEEEQEEVTVHGYECGYGCCCDPDPEEEELVERELEEKKQARRNARKKVSVE